MRPARVAVLFVPLLVACAPDATPGIVGHGTVEVTETDVAPIATARVVRIAVQEGQRVALGDTLVVLVQSALPAQLEGQRARVLAAAAAVRDLERGARPQELDAARAELAGAEADVERTARELVRIGRLADGNAVSRQALDNAEAAARTASSRRDAARERLALLQAGSRPERIRQAEAELANARAAYDATLASAGDLVLLAPADAVVLSRTAEPGEVLTPGTPALTLGDVHRPWVRLYLAARDVGRIRVGQPARVALDGIPDRTFDGAVAIINPRAEFTPRAALSEEERADLMFGVRVDLRDTTGAVKPGLPATVTLDPIAP
ncbi:MAG: efflux RND transporter periplasmic adaptor subunit [Gemmatimonadales bacterium]|nr:efflux RND transporter periplasmic adaptor subunit [Gemmatimonadales bacterium]